MGKIVLNPWTNLRGEPKTSKTEYHKQWSRKNRDKGLCNCGLEPVPNRKYCAKCQARQKEYGRKQKRELLAAYGGKCECYGGCAVNEPDFLSIDHVNNDGKEHRRRLGAASAVYRDLKRRGYPKDGYRLLCFNCNFARAKFGNCPHERSSEI